MKGERQCREYFDFSQKNCMGSEIFNCENEWSGNPAWLCWRNFWWYWKAVVQSEVLSGWFDYCLVPGLLVASSRTPTCFVTLETCRKNCSESDFLQQATYSQNFLRPGKKLFLLWGCWKECSDPVFKCLQWWGSSAQSPVPGCSSCSAVCVYLQCSQAAAQLQKLLYSCVAFNFLLETSVLQKQPCPV